LHLLRQVKTEGTRDADGRKHVPQTTKILFLARRGTACRILKALPTLPLRERRKIEALSRPSPTTWFMFTLESGRENVFAWHSIISGALANIVREGALTFHVAFCWPLHPALTMPTNQHAPPPHGSGKLSLGIAGRGLPLLILAGEGTQARQRRQTTFLRA